MKKRYVLIPVLVLVLLAAAFVAAALWKGSGTLFDFIAGQSEPEPRSLDRAASTKSGSGQPYAVQVAVDSSRPAAEVSPSFLSFSIDGSQVSGGKWWNPTASSAEIGSGTVHAPLYDFNRPRLNLLAKALAPAYLRIGGSESDKLFYDLNSALKEPSPPPAGYQSVLTRQQWDEANAFASRNGLQMVFTLNAGPGSRKADGSWDSANSTALIQYSAQKGYPVSVWELGNELNIFWFVHGFKAQISVDQYVKDLQNLRQVVNQVMPQSRLGGQGSAIWPVLGEPLGTFYGFLPDYIKGASSLVDQISWHYYPQQSRRGPVASRRAFPSTLLNPTALDEAGLWADRMNAWRNDFAPKTPVWLAETGNAQFGGEPGVSDAYIGGLWWVDELGLMARKGTQVMVRQTLSGMNYGMIDDDTLEPRPDFWNSLLWKRLMGTRAYPVTVSGENSSRLRAYAMSAAGKTDGALTVLLINLDDKRSASASLPGFANRAGELFRLTSPDLFGQALLLNGKELKISGDQLPALQGEPVPASAAPQVTLNPLSYAFVTFQP